MLFGLGQIYVLTIEAAPLDLGPTLVPPTHHELILNAYISMKG